MPEKKMNISISDGLEFFAHELSINFNPMQFIFDFKCITPRIDPRSKGSATMAIRHNVVMMDAYHTKRLHDLLGDVIKRYEKEFGKIKKPKQLEKAEKKRKDKDNSMKKEELKNTPNYFG